MATSDGGTEVARFAGKLLPTSRAPHDVPERKRNASDKYFLTAILIPTVLLDIRRHVRIYMKLAKIFCRVTTCHRQLS